MGEVWFELLNETPRATFFQSLPWLKTYWDHFAGDQQLRVLVEQQGSEVVGILPLVARTEDTKVGRIRYLTYPLDYWGSFYGPIGRHPADTLRHGIEYLARSGTNADVLELRWLSSEDQQAQHAEQIMKSVGYSPVCDRLDPTAVIDLPETWDEYLSSRTGKWRNNLRRWERNLAEYGTISYRRFRSQRGDNKAAGQEFFAECQRIASQSWQSHSTTGTTLTHQNVAAFLGAVHSRAVECGCVDINLLYLGEEAIAFAYNYVFNGHIFGLRIGYTADLPCKGAGNLLYAKTIEDSIARGDWRYDMGPRHIEIKRALMTRELPVYRLSCYKSLSVRQQLMKLKRLWDNRNAPVLSQSVVVDQPSIGELVPK